MPKSRHKKTRYIPRTTGATRTEQINTAAAVTNKPAVATAAGKTNTAASKITPTFNIAHVGPELKVIGIITAVILIAIVALYFILR
jgi:hypothetical protein